MINYDNLAKQFNGTTNFDALASQFGGTSSSQPIQAPTPTQPEKPSVGGFLGNVVSSAGNFVGGIGQAIMHPIKTVQGLAGVAAGGVEKLIPGEQPQEQNFNNVVDFFKQRYGSPDKLLTTIYKDPVGFAADLSLVFGGAAGAVSKIAGLGKVGEVASVASKAGEVANAAGTAAEVTQRAGMMQRFADAMQRATLRLTPAKTEALGSKIADVTTYLNETPGFVGTKASRFEKVASDYATHENQLQAALKTVETPIDKAALIKQANRLKADFQTERDSLAINKQINGFVNTLKAKWTDQIKASDLNKLKRSTYQNAFNAAGTKVSDAVEYAIGDMLRQSIEEAAAKSKITVAGKTIGQFNKEYGTVINAKKLLKAASNKADSGFTEKILSGIAGYAVGGVPGGILATEAATRGGTLVRSALARGATAIGKSGALPKTKILVKTPLKAYVAGRGGLNQSSPSNQSAGITQ